MIKPQRVNYQRNSSANVTISADTVPVENHYEEIMCRKIAENTLHVEPYDRRLFLNLIMMVLQNYCSRACIVDWGAGTGAQAQILLHKWSPVIEQILLVEQPKIVESLKKSYSDSRMTFCNSEDFVPSPCDLFMAHGSLSYSEKPLTLLGQALSTAKVVAISRFLVSADIDHPLQIRDPKGDHVEIVSPEKSLINQAKNSGRKIFIYEKSSMPAHKQCVQDQTGRVIQLQNVSLILGK